MDLWYACVNGWMMKDLLIYSIDFDISQFHVSHLSPKNRESIPFPKHFELIHAKLSAQALHPSPLTAGKSQEIFLPTTIPSGLTKGTAPVAFITWLWKATWHGIPTATFPLIQWIHVDLRFEQPFEVIKTWPFELWLPKRPHWAHQETRHLRHATSDQVSARMLHQNVCRL